jgi:hypothetical protein
VDSDCLFVNFLSAQPFVSTPSTEVLGWLFEAGASGDLQKASDAFKSAAAIIDKLADAEPT